MLNKSGPRGGGVGGVVGVSMGLPLSSYAITNSFSVERMISRNFSVRSAVMRLV